MSFLGFHAHLPLALSVGVVLAAATGGSVFALFDHTKCRDAVLMGPSPEVGVVSSPTEEVTMEVTAREPVLVDFALQGGGSHRAFTRGVLDRLIEEPWLGIEAISGTSASAMNAALMADGWSGAEGARAALDAYCHVDLARRQPCRSFRIIVERVSFDQRCITQ